MADIKSEVTDPASQVEAPIGAPAPEVEASPRGSVRDTAAIEAELARHEPSTPAVLSNPEN